VAFFQRVHIGNNPYHDYILWLPYYSDQQNPLEESEDSVNFREDMMLFDVNTVTYVKWKTQGKIIRCQLYYNLDAECTYYLQKALEHLAILMGWDKSVPDPVFHFDEHGWVPTGTIVMCDDGEERSVYPS